MKLITAMFAALAVGAIGFIALLYTADASRARADVVHVHMDDSAIVRVLGNIGSSREDVERFLFDARIQRSEFNPNDRTIWCVLYEHDRLPFVPRSSDVGVRFYFDADNKVSRIHVERPARG